MVAFLIMKNIQRHMDAEDLERYSMGNTTLEESESIEKHLLTCEDCRDHLRETDDYLLAMRTSSARLRRDERSARRRQWRFPAWSPALAAAACLLVVVFALRSGRPPSPVVSVALTAVRGIGAGSIAPAGHQLILHPDMTGLADASSYRLEIVDLKGRRVRQGTIARAQDGIGVPGLGAGQYFVRLYLPAGELLREYGLQISEPRP
jgi:hypothetical protein